MFNTQRPKASTSKLSWKYAVAGVWRKYIFEEYHVVLLVFLSKELQVYNKIKKYFFYKHASAILKGHCYYTLKTCLNSIWSVFGEGEVEITTLYDLNIFYTKSQWTIDQNCLLLQLNNFLWRTLKDEN